MRSNDARPVTTIVPLPPSYRGGTEEYAYRVVRLLSEKFPGRVITTSVRWDPRAEVLPTGRASVERLPAREVFERPLLWSPSARRQLFQAVRSAGVLHLHMPFPLVEAPAVRSARRQGMPIVLTYHMDADLAGFHSAVLARAVTAAYRRWSAHPALDGADAVVSNSLGYAKASPVLSQHLDKVRVIPKGVDPLRLGLPARSPDRPRPSCVPADRVPPGRARLLFVGRLVAYKGLPILLEACRDLVRDGVDVELLVAGRGPEEASLREAATSLGLGDRVDFLGFVPDRELGPLYRFADVVVVPSLNPLESTATALEEAVACGTPVVGTTLPGTEETVPNDDRRGNLVPPGDAAALRDAIARRLRGGRFEPPAHPRTWAEVAKDYWELYLEVGALVRHGPRVTRPDLLTAAGVLPTWDVGAFDAPRSAAIAVGGGEPISEAITFPPTGG